MWSDVLDFDLHNICTTDKLLSPSLFPHIKNVYQIVSSVQKFGLEVWLYIFDLL